MDVYMRRVLAPALDRVAGRVDRAGITPNRLTSLGLALGLVSAVAAGAGVWSVALILWLLSRTADGVDGALARRQTGGSAPAGAGGFFDISADFVVYGATVLGVAYGADAAHSVSLWPFLLVLAAYYVNGTTLLAYSSIAERTGRRIDDGRALTFTRGIAGATETIVVHSLWLLFPAIAWHIAWPWAVIVAVNAAAQIVSGYRRLR